MLAPRWHTAALIALILTVAATGALLTAFSVPATAGAGSASAASASRALVYLPILAVQWGLVFYVCRFGRRENALGFLLGRQWARPRDALVDVAIAAAAWLFILGLEIAWRYFAPSGVSAVGILPRSALDRALWLVVAISVGISEELVYRGYLRVQLAAWTGSERLAIVFQAALFGIAHLDQGARAVPRMMVYGLLFGAIARWRRSLLPVILCHAWTDVASGLFHG